MIVGVCRLIANHLHLAFFRKHTRSQGPSLHRHYPASTVILPCPTPADAAARSDVEAATLAPNGSPPITRTTFPTCRAHYPGGSSGCLCRLLPRITQPSPNGRRVGIRIVTFEACSGFTHVTARRIAHSRPQATFVTRLQPMRLPAQAARQLPDQSTTLRVDSSSTDDSRLQGALPSENSCTAAGAFRFSPSPTQGTSMPRAGAVHHINSVVWGERTNTFLWSALPRDRATVNVAQDSRPARAGCSTRLPGWSPPHLPAAGTRAPRDPARRAGPGSRNHHGCDSAPRSTGGRRPRVPVALSLRRMRRRIRPAMQVNVCG